MAFIRLDFKAYTQNLTQIAKKAGGFEKLICVFKNNAYAHGINLLSPIAKALGVSFIALKNEREALELEIFFEFLNKASKNIKKDFLNPAFLNKINESHPAFSSPNSASKTSKISKNASFENILILSHIPNGKENPKFIYAANDIKSFEAFKKGTKLHLVIDTGMHRNGVLLKDIEKAFQKARALKLEITGIFTHFAGSDEMDASFFVQRQKFDEAKKIAQKAALNLGFKKLIFHASNSAALFRSSKIPTDELCRVGLAQFGYNDFAKLKKVLSLYAEKLSSCILESHECVGYGGKFSASKPLKIATYDLGYADGLFRFDGASFDQSSLLKPKDTQKLTLANDKSLLGCMSMDSFSCEDVGAQVCVFKDADIFARYFNTINYEILAKLSPYIKRILV